MKDLDAEALCRQLAEQIRPHVSPATALVGGEYRQGMAAVELVGEAPAARGELVLAAVEMGGDADHECDGMPLGDQPGDGGEALVVRFGVQGDEGAGLAGLEFAAGDADAGEAEVEAEQGAAGGERSPGRGSGGHCGGAAGGDRNGGIGPLGHIARDGVDCRLGGGCRVRHARRPR